MDFFEKLAARYRACRAADRARERCEPALMPSYWCGGGDGTFKGRGSPRFTLKSLGLEKYAHQFIRLPVVRWDDHDAQRDPVARQLADH